MKSSQGQPALGLQPWERMVEQQLDAMGQITVQTTEIDIDTTIRQRDDMGLRTLEVEDHFRQKQIFIVHESRKKELISLRKEIREGKFSPFCTDCGIPLTVEMFSNHASRKCVPCRAKEKKSNHLLGTARPAVDFVGIYTAKEKKPKKR